MPDLSKLRLIAGWTTLEPDEKIHIATASDYRDACARIDRLECALKDALFGRVAERMGHDLAVTMDKSDWKTWPDYVPFVDQRIEKARKALLDLP